jgi:hypothetical protein
MSSEWMPRGNPPAADVQYHDSQGAASAHVVSHRPSQRQRRDTSTVPRLRLL